MASETAPLILPKPRSLQRREGFYTLPHRRPASFVRTVQTDSAPAHPEGYVLSIDKHGVTLEYRQPAGLRAAKATLQQLMRQYGRRLPCLRIRDWPDFARRGVMLDVSRGRVPKLETLLDLAEKLADYKINELQLYTEHTFAYPNYRSIWQSWGALTGREIQILDARCRELGIDLVPNQNSFGHLRYFLADSRLKDLAELAEPYESETGDFLRRPTTLAPNHPGTLPFLRGLYNELLPNFSSDRFNVGCDETWDLGRGQTKKLCQPKGKGKGKGNVYLEFLRRIHHELARRGKTMMFWGDIILKYPKLIPKLRTFRDPGGENPNIIVLAWGYEADHPFEREASQFAAARIPFYVCPGTSTWQTLIGRHDNAFANLRAAARAGKRFGAAGYLITDWGDGGHPQPLAVSWPLYLAGASLAWNASSLDQRELPAVLNRDIFQDSAERAGAAALKLGLAHRLLGVKAPNETPLGTVIAAPKPEDRELFCRNGLKWHKKIPHRRIVAAIKEIERQRSQLRRAKPVSKSGKVLVPELDLAADLAEQSCRFMLWQQAVAAGRLAEAAKLAMAGIAEIRKLEQDFAALWPKRNKGTTRHCTPFLRWRIEDYARWLRQNKPQCGAQRTLSATLDVPRVAQSVPQKVQRQQRGH
jgi:hypothetical protein